MLRQRLGTCGVSSLLNAVLHAVYGSCLPLTLLHDCILFLVFALDTQQGDTVDIYFAEPTQQQSTAIPLDVRPQHRRFSTLWLLQYHHEKPCSKRIQALQQRLTSCSGKQSRTSLLALPTARAALSQSRALLPKGLFLSWKARARLGR